MLHIIRALTVWGCLATGSSAAADTRIMVLFDTSGSMDDPVSLYLCFGADSSCWVTKAYSQIYTFSAALGEIRWPDCVHPHIQVWHWNTSVQYRSDWYDIKTEDGRLLAQGALLGATPTVEGKTKPQRAFAEAHEAVRQNPNDQHAVVMVSDGKPTAGWHVTSSSAQAAEDDFLFFEIVYDQHLSPDQLRAEYVDALRSIKDSFHVCVG